MSQKRKVQQAAQDRERRKKSKRGQNESILKLPAVLEGCFSNLFYDSIPWLAPDVLAAPMELITQRLFHETPNFLHPLSVVSPCAYTRTTITRGIVQILQRELMAKHRRLMFRAPKNNDYLDGVLATNRKEIEAHIRAWCTEISNAQDINIDDEGEGIRCQFAPILIIEIPEAQAYQARDLDFSLQVVRETVLKAGLSRAHIVLLLSIDMYADRIHALSNEWNPEPLPIQPVPAEVADSSDEDEEDDGRPPMFPESDKDDYDIPKDIWWFQQAQQELQTLHNEKDRYSTMILPFPPMRQNTRPYDFRARFAKQLAATMKKVTSTSDAKIDVPYVVGFALAEMYPSSGSESFGSFIKFTEFASFRVISLVQSIQQEFRGDRHAPKTDICQVRLGSNALSITVSSNERLLPSKKCVSIPLPKPWSISTDVVTATQAKLEEAKMAHHFELSASCSAGISENVGVIARNAPNAGTLAVAELTKFAVPGSLLLFNPEFCTISQHSVTGRIDLDFAWAVTTTLSRHERELAETKEQLIRLEGAVREMKENQKNPQPAAQAVIPEQPRRRYTFGGIYKKEKHNQFVGYSIQTKVNGRNVCMHVGKYERRGDILYPVSAETLRAKALEFGLPEDSIAKSLDRLKML